MNPADDHRDPDVDAAWRAASRDLPPPALDAAIAAAARRAVGAGPKRLDAPRAWWPVAAAAVVAVVAIGIVEMTPPDEVAPTQMTPAAPQAPAAAESAPGQDTLRDERAGAPAAVAEPTPRRRVEATRKLERASPPTRTDAAATANEATREATSEAARQREPAPAREAAKPGVPFPASPSDASPAMNAAAPPAADRLTTAPASPKARQQTPPSSAGASVQQAPAPFAEDERKTEPAAAGALAMRREAAPSNAEPALAKRTQDTATVTGEAQPRTVDEWVRLIRRLKAEGRNDVAAKELAAFRAKYQDRADALLPADLRDAKP
jgi:hypothetical protein